MWVGKWIEVKQLLKQVSQLSVVWVSMVGIWGIVGVYGMIKIYVATSYLWNNKEKKMKFCDSVSPTWIASYSFRIARVRIKQNLLMFLLTTQLL